MTGASGRIGSHIIPHLVERGHTITGLVRSSVSAEKVMAFGPSAQPLYGDISDCNLLISTTKSHDAVVHCAMDLSSGPEAGAQKDRETVLLFGNALETTEKFFVMSSPTGLLQSPADEQSLPSATRGTRAGTEIAMLGFKDRGIRSIALRLAVITHNPEKMHPILGLLLSAVDKLGYIPYLGENRWSACHSDDAGLLCALALESADPGTAVHAVDECIKVKDIAEALGRKTGLKVAQVEQDRLSELGFLSFLLTLDQDVGTQLTSERFGWQPKGQRLLAEIAAAGQEYFQIDHVKRM